MHQPLRASYERNRRRFIDRMIGDATPISVARARAAILGHADPYPYGEPPSFRYRAFLRFVKGRRLPWDPCRPMPKRQARHLLAECDAAIEPTE